MLLWVRLVITLLQNVNSVSELHTIVTSIPRGLQEL